MVFQSNQITCEVKESCSGKKWIRRPQESTIALAISQKFDLPDLLGTILSSRGFNLGDVERFLNPKISAELPNPYDLLDMRKGVERIVKAVKTGEKIAVFGDYDVDGATSSALICRYFQALNVDIRIYIPDRVKEGYGPNEQAIDVLKAENIALIITVDCGTTSHSALRYAKNVKIDTIVLDHHVAEAKLPEAAAVINPNRLDEINDCKQLAAVGVSFLLLVAINKFLRDTNFFEENGLIEPNLFQWLDLVALGTVADVVPLTGVNRAFVSQGLKVMAKRANEGLVALADIVELDQSPDAYHLGFVFGPRVNAGGRVGECYLGARLLSTCNQGEANDIASKLHEYNLKRQAIESEVLSEAIAMAESQKNDGAVIVVGKEWHQGVIGIIASRLKDRFNIPACVLSKVEGKVVGSGRSIPGIDLGSIVISARQAGLIDSGGGHAMAAGFSLTLESVEEFSLFIKERVNRYNLGEDLKPIIYFDGSLSLGGCTEELVTFLDKLKPFGSGNPEPRFLFSDLVVSRADVVGREHIRCYLKNLSGGGLQAICFRSVDTVLGKSLLNSGGIPIHVIGRLRINSWRGRSSVQLIIDDVSEAN